SLKNYRVVPTASSDGGDNGNIQCIFLNNSKTDSVDDEKIREQASKSEDYVKFKFGQEEGNNYALNAL
ncbi:unnamed protein product, partial [Sphenostylis stenocarpa]